MTHDEVIALACDLDAEAAGGSDVAQVLPPEAAAHVRTCTACADVLRALSLGRTDERAFVEPAPATYWDDFNARLAARLRTRPRRGVAFPRWATAAAAVVAFTAVTLLLLRQPLPSGDSSASAAGGVATASLRTLSSTDPATLQELADELASAPLGEDVEDIADGDHGAGGSTAVDESSLPMQGGAVDSVADELARTLDASEQRALLEALQAETAS